jgi:hypothetical protein
MAAEQSQSAEPDTWREYIAAETERVVQEAGPDLALAMIHSRAIESPDFYFKSLRYYEDLAKHHYGQISTAGYWEKIALRALVLLKVPIEERERLIAEAHFRNLEARKRVRAKIAKGPGGPFKEVDLSQLKI